MTEPGQDPEEQKLQLNTETIKDLTPREEESAELKGGARSDLCHRQTQ